MRLLCKPTVACLMFPLSAHGTAVPARATRQVAGPHNYRREAIMERIHACFWLLVLILTGTIAAAGQSSQPVITPANAAQVKEVARLGNGTYYKAAWSSDGKT